MFHPQGTGLCGHAAGSNNLAFFISVFAACGTFGSAVGPVYIVYAVDTIGKKGLPIMILPIMLVCIYFFSRIGFDVAHTAADESGKHGGKEFFSDIRSIMKKIGGIVTIATIRDSANLGIRLFLPTLIVSRGGTIREGGQLVFAVTMASTISSMIGGRLADKVGYTKIVIGALSFSPALLLAALHTNGAKSVVLLVLGFGFLLASSSVTTAMSQQRCPSARSMVSSLSMGTSWGLANLFTSPVGFLADRIGLLAAMNFVALIPWTITLWFLFPKFRIKK